MTLRSLIVVTAVTAAVVAGRTGSAWPSRLDTALADSSLTPAAADSALTPAAADTVLAGTTLVGAKAALPDTALARVTFPAFGTEPGREVGHLGLVGRVGRGVANFGSDVWAVVSGPFRSPTSLMWTGAALGVASILYTNDQAILDAAVRNRNEQGMKQVVDAGQKVEPLGLMGRTNPYYMGALAAGYVLNVPPMRTVALEILESHMIAGGVRNVAKIVVGRHHPYDNQGPYAFEFGVGTSFPSGHTSVGYELATILTMNTHSVPVGVASYGLATALAVQRVESRNHWASDVFVAGVYGTLIAHTVVKQHNMRERQQRHGPPYVIVPDIGDDGRLGIRVTTRF